MGDSRIQLSLKNVSIKLKYNWIAELERGNFSFNKHAKEVCLIKSASFSIPEGTLFAILGGSGSGKTTLLNVIAGRYDKLSYEVLGNVRFGASTRSIGYVTQSDYLMPNLTVRETLMFTAKLKVDASAAEVEKLVMNVLLDLGLKECMDSRIGDTNMTGNRRGISGGEKRRVSVALQIITSPQVLCADEPTSGLDSFTAITVMESLKRLTETRKTTVVCSVHQPRADIFNIFDQALILSKGGHTLFCGPTAELVPYFARLGYDCPVHANPADFFIDLVSVDHSSSDSKQEGLARIDFLITSYQSAIKDNKGGNLPKAEIVPTDSLKGSLSRISWFCQVRYLMNRFLINEYRDTTNITGGIAQSVVLSLVCMAIFWNLPNDSSGISSRVGLLYIDVSMENYMLMVILIERYCRELKIFDRELQDDLYHPSAYYIAHILSNMLLLTIITICFSVPLYFGSGMRAGFEYFLIYALVNFTMILVINGLVWMSVSMDRRFSVASLIANVSFTFVSLAAGFLVNYDTIPIYVRWVKDISFLSYGYRILMDNEFSGQTYNLCSYVDITGTSTLVCSDVPGSTILSQYSVGENAYTYSWPILIFIGLIYYGIAGILLNFLRFPPTGSVASDLALHGEYDEDDEGHLDDIFSRASEDTGSKRSHRHGDSLPSVSSSMPASSESSYPVKTIGSGNEERPSFEIDYHNPIDISVNQQRSSLKSNLLSSVSSPKTKKQSIASSSNEIVEPELEYEDEDMGDIEENNEKSPDGEYVHQFPAKSVTSTEIRLLEGVVINVYKVDLFVKRPTDSFLPLPFTNQFDPDLIAASTASAGQQQVVRDSDLSSADLVRPSEGSMRTVAPPPHPTVLEISHKSQITNNNSYPLGKSSPSHQRPSDKFKHILHEISLEIRPGKLVAIMGGSGSGKTTLLNLIANRIPQSCLTPRHHLQDITSRDPRPNEAVLNGCTQFNPVLNILGSDDDSLQSNEKPSRNLTGHHNSINSPAPSTAAPASEMLYQGLGGVYFNGRVPSQRDVRRLIGYVQQFDFHLPSLTIFETLLYQAKLRLYSPTFAHHRGHRRQQYQEAQRFYKRRVERVLKTLGLRSVRHVRVGDDETKGISGGEKRRLSIGIQLLSNPAICLLDEPTTGLDAFTARKIVLTLRDLVQGKLTGLYQAGPTGRENVSQDTREIFHSSDMLNRHTRTTDVSATMYPSFTTPRDTNSSGYNPSSSPSQSSTTSVRKTVILSIHQPRYDIFAAIDEVILLSRGQLVWAGNSEQMLEHFSRIGYSCPAFTNPADFILDLSSVDFRSEDREVESRNRLTNLVQAFSRVQEAEQSIRPFIPPLPPSASGSHASSSRRQRVTSTNTWRTRISSLTMSSALLSNRSSIWSGSNQSQFNQNLFTNRKGFFTTYIILLQRGFVNLVRQPPLLLNRITQCLFYALILSCFYSPLGDNQVSIQNRIGLLYELTPLCFIGMLNCIAIFPTERGIFFREYVDGYYPAFAFLAAYFTIALPIMFIGAAGIGALTTCATGLTVEADSFLKFSYVLFLFIATGESVGVAFCMGFDEIGFAVNIMSAIFSLFSITAGFISLNMPQFLIDLSYASPLRWGAYILANTAFAGETFTCDDDDLQSFGGNSCALSTGQEVLDLYGFTSETSMRYHYVMVSVVAVIYFVLCLLVFRWRAYKLSH